MLINKMQIMYYVCYMLVNIINTIIIVLIKTHMIKQFLLLVYPGVD